MGSLDTNITCENLQHAKGLLDQHGPGAMYDYLSSFGDRYSTLANGVVNGDTLSAKKRGRIYF